MSERTELPLSVDDREGFGGEDGLDPDDDDCGGGMDGSCRAALPRIDRLWSCAACNVAASTFSISSRPKIVAKSRANVSEVEKGRHVNENGHPKSSR